jgi:methyl-accepting chemotaxis protein
MLRPFGKTISYLTKLKELGVLPMKLVHQTLNTMSMIANYYKDNPIRRKVIRQARRYRRMLKPFGKTISYLTKLKDLGVLPMKLVHQTLNAMSIITDFYKQQEFGFFESIRLKHTSSLISGFISNFAEAVESFKSLSDSKSIPLNEINNIINSINNISNMDPTNISSVGSAISSAISGVEYVDISKVQAVTDMFNAFNGINKSENAINKFTESVKEFTTTCKNLIDAMGDNTNAINSIDGISVNEYSTKEILDNNVSENSSNGNGNVSKSGIQILNVEEIAKTIAEKINGALYVDIPDTQIQLLINGMGGNEWTISRY